MTDNSGIPITSDTITETINKSFIELSYKYADMYRENPKNFVRCFFQYNSIRMVCQSIVSTYTQAGALQEINHDFTEWVKTQPIHDKWKPVLNDILRIIYSLTN